MARFTLVLLRNRRPVRVFAPSGFDEAVDMLDSLAAGRIPPDSPGADAALLFYGDRQIDRVKIPKLEVENKIPSH